MASRTREGPLRPRPQLPPLSTGERRPLKWPICGDVDCSSLVGLFKLWRSRIDRIALQNTRSGATSTVALWWASGLTESPKKCPIWDDNNFSPPAGLLDLRYFRIDRIVLKNGRSGGDDDFRSAHASLLPQFSPHGNFACNRRFDRISTFYAGKKNKVRIFSLQNRGR